MSFIRTLDSGCLRMRRLNRRDVLAGFGRLCGAALFLALSALLVSCQGGDGPEHANFAGQQYSGSGVPGLKVPEDQVAPIGNAISVEAPNISDHTVYGLEGVSSEDAIVLRRNDGSWALFISARFDLIPSLCPYFDPQPNDCQ